MIFLKYLGVFVAAFAIVILFGWFNGVELVRGKELGELIINASIVGGVAAWLSGVFFGFGD